MPWSSVVAAALYGPGGFYSSGRGAGRSRDFLTSPELGPLFGAIVARAIDREWDRCGRPDPWVVVEAGAGAGTLAASVLAAEPGCAAALRYIAVEPSAPLRGAAASHLRLEDPSQVLGPHAPPEPDDAGPPAALGRGPLVTVLAELPAGPFAGMVIANELLDNLPFDVYERTASGWAEVRVAWDGGLLEVLVPALADVATTLSALAPDAPLGGRVPWQAGARQWVRRALATLERGRVVVIDYGRSTPALAAAGPDSWLRTYRSGGLGGPPLDRLGFQDITADVAWDQLGPALATSTQAAWLESHGLDDLRSRAAEEWQARAAIGDLAALRARARAREAATLREPAGLGSFTVAEWVVGIA